MIFNTGNKTGAENALNELEKLSGQVIEIKKVKQTRSSQQNRALHLFFNQVSEELNNIGIPFIYHGLKGQKMEMQWSGLLFKEMTWKPIQKALYGTESTTKLTKEQIDPIFEIINKFFAEKGIEVTFPNQFDLYLKLYQK